MSNIEWTESTWNPVVGCSPVSPGCLNCYAATMARRLHGMTLAGRNVPGYESPPLTDLSGGRRVFNGTVRCLEDRLGVPLRWKSPRTVFVCSMSDLFHEDVPTEFIDRVYGLMSLCGQHTFQVLTKRTRRMAEYTRDEETPERVRRAAEVMSGGGVPGGNTARRAVPPRGRAAGEPGCRGVGLPGSCATWPLPNVWHGTSAEDQRRLDQRTGWLLRTLSAVRFLSLEPLLGPIVLPVIEDAGEDLERDEERGGWGLPSVAIGGCGSTLDWVIVGGESGRGARPCRAGWIVRIVNYCRAWGVPVFVKQLGAHVIDRNDVGFEADGHTWADGRWAGRPVDLRAWPSSVDVEDDPVDRGYQGAPVRVRLQDRKGADMSEWPECLRVRQMPGEVVR